MINAQGFAHAINKVVANVSKLEKKIEQLEGKNMNVTNKTTELPVHNGKKVTEDIQDSLDSTMQRVDYLENSAREMKKTNANLVEEIKTLRQQLQNGNGGKDMQQNDKSKIQLNGIEKQMNIIQEETGDMREKIKSIVSSSRAQMTELREVTKDMQAQLQIHGKKLEDNQSKGNDLVEQMEARVAMTSDKLKKEMEHIQDKMTNLELELENKTMNLANNESLHNMELSFKSEFDIIRKKIESFHKNEYANHVKLDFEDILPHARSNTEIDAVLNQVQNEKKDFEEMDHLKIEKNETIEKIETNDTNEKNETNETHESQMNDENQNNNEKSKNKKVMMRRKRH